jgi:hypothetical protein
MYLIEVLHFWLPERLELKRRGKMLSDEQIGKIRPKDYNTPLDFKRALCKAQEKATAKEIKQALLDYKPFQHKCGISNGDMWTGNRVGEEKWLKMITETYDSTERKQVVGKDWEAFWQALKARYKEE